VVNSAGGSPRNPQRPWLLVGMERIAKRHRQTLNELMGVEYTLCPSDST